MYRRISAVMFPVTAIFLAAALYWGITQMKSRNAVAIEAENQYQRAFHDLSYHVNTLHGELGKALVAGPAASNYHRKCLINIWRLAGNAQSDVNQLPLSKLPVNKTEAFLSKLSDFSYRASVRNLQKHPLSKDEMKMMQALYKRSGDISGQLEQIRSQVLGRNLRWLDTESAMSAKNSQRENSILDGFKTVDKSVGSYPELNWGPATASLFQKRNVKILGNAVTKASIRAKAADFLGLPHNTNFTITENGSGTEYASYTARLKKGDNLVTMDYSKHGGKLLWFMRERPMGNPKLDTAQASRKAERFLQGHGYKGMHSVGYDSYGNADVYVFAAVKNNTIIYPEQLTVKVALDNGQIIGMQAAEYAYERQNRHIPAPRITKAQAEHALNPDFKILESRHAVVKNDSNQEVLTYEFQGELNGESYRVFVNADNGDEEYVERIGNPASA